MNLYINGSLLAGFYDDEESRDHLITMGFSLESIEAAFDAEKWKHIRVQRDKYMSETDWTQFSDSPLTPEKKAEFIEYRNELRNIPQNYGKPDEVIWPEKPTV
ncbi:phage tail assembly chaperone [Vibrio vulnificus]